MTDTEPRTATCVICHKSLHWVVDGLNPDGVWLDEDHVAVDSDGHRHGETSCLGCGQIGTPSTVHGPTGVYLCAERCVPAIRAALATPDPDHD